MHTVGCGEVLDSLHCLEGQVDVMHVVLRRTMPQQLPGQAQPLPGAQVRVQRPRLPVGGRPLQRRCQPLGRGEDAAAGGEGWGGEVPAHPQRPVVLREALHEAHGPARVGEHVGQAEAHNVTIAEAGELQLHQRLLAALGRLCRGWATGGSSA